MSSVQTPPASLLSEFAIVVDPKDNVAVVKNAIQPGLELLLPNGLTLEIRGTIPPGHRFATKDIPAGEFVLQFGQPIGTSLGIGQGEQITHANMTDEVGQRVFEHIVAIANGLEAKAETHKHREFQFWAEQNVSL